MRRTFPLGLLFALGACTLATDLSGFDDGAPADAGAPPPPDASEASVPEAGGVPPPFVLPDAGDTEGCARPGVVCDGFDMGGIGERWTRVERTLGVMEFLTTDVRSGTRSLHAHTDPAINLRPVRAYLEHAMPVASRVRCAFDVLVRSGLSDDSSQVVDILQVLGTGPGIDRYQLKLGVEADATTVRADVFYAGAACDCPRGKIEGRPIALGTWTAVIFETNFTHTFVSFDGTTVLDADHSPDKPTTSMAITVGIESFKRSDADVSYDNVVCAFMP